MSPKKFEEIVTPLIKIRGKNIKSRKTITLKDDREYSLIIDCVHEPRPCDDCGSLVAGRSCSIFNSRFAGVKGVKRSPVDHWIKYCHTCEKKWDYTGQKTKNAK